MGLQAKLTAVRLSMFQGNSCDKQGDETFMPTQPPLGRSTWPTWVVEVGVSESIDELHLDAKWWLANSNSDVRKANILMQYRCSVLRCTYAFLDQVQTRKNCQNVMTGPIARIRHETAVAKVDGFLRTKINISTHWSPKVSPLNSPLQDPRRALV